MSIKGMTDDEWASYEIGVAIRKQLDAGNHDPETLKHIEAVFGWLQQGIKPDELHSVSLLIGYFIDGDFDGEVPSIMGHSRLYEKPPKRPGRRPKHARVVEKGHILQQRVDDVPPPLERRTTSPAIFLPTTGSIPSRITQAIRTQEPILPASTAMTMSLLFPRAPPATSALLKEAILARAISARAMSTLL